MTKYQLYKLLKKTEALKDQRNPMFERNRFIKFIGYFMAAYYAALMILMGVSLGFGLKGHYSAAFHRLDGGFFYLLILDFWLRFMVQETPAQKAHTYALLPIRRSFLISTYLIRTMLSLGNLTWSFFLVPFGLVSVVPLLGWKAFLGWLIGYWLLFVLNGLIYLFTRALCMKHILWFLVPLALHAGLVCACVLPDHNIFRVPFVMFMYDFVQWKLFPYLIVFAAIAFALWANYKLQMGMVYNEAGKKEEVKLEKASEFKMFNRFGVMGEYLKMEIKLRMRNKQARMQFFVGLGCMLMLSGLLYFTDVYDGEFMKSFICLYDYIMLGMTTLITIMCYEGNYIDGLMSRRETIYDLLRAKFYFNSAMLLIPAILLIPLMVAGKISPMMNFGYLFFTVGVLYPCIFQMTVYNKNTLPLNVKLAGGSQGTMIQSIISICALFLPICIEKISILLLGNVWGYLPLIVLGAIGLATHPLWLKNIYHRFMLRRYENMEGFRASRK